MAWRNKAQITGQNMVPLGATRRWGGAGGAGGGGDDSASPSGFGGSLNGNGAASSSQGYGNGNNQQFVVPQYNSGGMLKRERDEESPANGPGAPSASASSADTPRKRRSRWGEEKTDLGVTTALGANVSEAEVERYAINVRIEEIARRLRSGDVVPPDRERSPSPTPTYDAQGRRTNTREVRYRKKLEEERVRLVDKQIKLDPNYKPPAEYTAAKRNMKPTEKIFLPIKEFPELNFFGLLVGPRGNSLKKMERESGAKISIRGKGSVKHGKGRAEDGDEEEMHCVITADDEESVKRCIRLINTVIETAASTPEAQNDHKRNQLRELAALNGTLRDDENQVCQNCGQKGHRKYECPEQRNWTANIVCHRCGQQGHLARDCTEGRGFPGVAAPGAGAGAGPRQGDPFNSEYESLMAELGQGGNANSAVGGQSGPVPTGPGARGGGTSAGPMDRPLDPDGKKIPPWRDPNVWNTPTFGGGPPRGPRMGMGYGGPNGGGGGGGYGGQHQQQPYMQQHRHQQQWGGAQQQQGAFGGFAQQYQQSEQPEGAAGAMAGQEQYANVNGGQPDYRQAWEEYYRQQGMDPAAAAAAAASAAAGGTGAADVQHAQPQQEPQSQQSQQQQDYSKEWEEYYRQQAAAAGSQQ